MLITIWKQHVVGHRHGAIQRQELSEMLGSTKDPWFPEMVTWYQLWQLLGRTETADWQRVLRRRPTPQGKRFCYRPQVL